MSYQDVTYDGVTFERVRFYESSEDGMGYELGFYYDGHYHGTAGIGFTNLSKDTFEVYWQDMDDGDFPAYTLFEYNRNWHDGEYVSYGEFIEETGEYEEEYEAVFIWMLCKAWLEFIEE